MTHLTNNIYAVEMPEGTVSAEIYDKESLPLAIMAYVKDPNGMFKPGIPVPIYPIPPGSYTLLFLSKEGTDDDWRKIIKSFVYVDNETGRGIYYYKDYEDIQQIVGADFSLDTPTESGHSLLRSKGLDVNNNYAII